MTTPAAKTGLKDTCLTDCSNYDVCAPCRMRILPNGAAEDGEEIRNLRSVMTKDGYTNNTNSTEDNRPECSKAARGFHSR